MKRINARNNKVVVVIMDQKRGTAKCQECQEHRLCDVQGSARVKELKRERAEALEGRNGVCREDQRAGEELAAQGTRFYLQQLSLFEDLGQDLLRDFRNEIFWDIILGY